MLMTPDDAAGPRPARTDRGLPASSAGDPEVEEADLDAAVTALSRLGANPFGFEALLVEVATFAVQAIPGADGAGLAMSQEERADTVVTTAEFVRRVDDIQYGLGEGPCISAAEQAQTVLSGSLGTDQRWPRFARRVAGLGVRSAVSVPLIAPGAVIGAINVYAHRENAFDARAAALGELFAVPAAIAVQNAQVLDQTRRLVAQLEHAVQTRGSVDRAVGIIISRTGATAEEALAHLRRVSQSEHRALADIADSLVAAAANRARARQHD